MYKEKKSTDHVVLDITKISEITCQKTFPLFASVVGVWIPELVFAVSCLVSTELRVKTEPRGSAEVRY